MELDYNNETLKAFKELVHVPLEDKFADCGLGEPKDSDYLTLALMAGPMIREFKKCFHDERPVISKDIFNGLVEINNAFYTRVEQKRVIMKYDDNLTDEKLAAIIYVACDIAYSVYVDEEIGPAGETSDNSLSIMHA